MMGVPVLGQVPLPHCLLLFMRSCSCSDWESLFILGSSLVSFTLRCSSNRKHHVRAAKWVCCFPSPACQKRVWFLWWRSLATRITVCSDYLPSACCINYDCLVGALIHMLEVFKNIFSRLNSINPSFLSGLCLFSFFFLFFLLCLELNLLKWEREEDAETL